MPGPLKSLIYTYTFSDTADKLNCGSTSILIQISSLLSLNFLIFLHL